MQAQEGGETVLKPEDDDAEPVSGNWIEAKPETLDGMFERVTRPYYYMSMLHFVPGWRCRACGWTVETEGLPPGHDCPSRTDSRVTQ